MFVLNFGNNVFENFEFEFCCSNFVSDETVIVNALKSAHGLYFI